MTRWLKFILLLLATPAFAYAPAPKFVPSCLTTPEIVRAYNRLGRVFKVEHAGQTLSREYNDVGQLLTEAYTAGPLVGLSVGHTYNPLLQREGMSAANGATAITGMGYGFTPAGSAQPQARLQTVTGGPAAVAFNYEANSSLLQSLNYGGNTTPWISQTLQHDFLNRLKQTTTSKKKAES